MCVGVEALVVVSTLPQTQPLHILLLLFHTSPPDSGWVHEGQKYLIATRVLTETIHRMESGLQEAGMRIEREADRDGTVQQIFPNTKKAEHRERQ